MSDNVWMYTAVAVTMVLLVVAVDKEREFIDKVLRSAIVIALSTALYGLGWTAFADHADRQLGDSLSDVISIQRQCQARVEAMGEGYRCVVVSAEIEE